LSFIPPGYNADDPYLPLNENGIFNYINTNLNEKDKILIIDAPGFQAYIDFENRPGDPLQGSAGINYPEIYSSLELCRKIEEANFTHILYKEYTLYSSHLNKTLEQFFDIFENKSHLLFNDSANNYLYELDCK